MNKTTYFIIKDCFIGLFANFTDRVIFAALAVLHSFYLPQSDYFPVYVYMYDLVCIQYVIMEMEISTLMVYRLHVMS